MKNLDELKLIIPDYKTLLLQLPEYIEGVGCWRKTYRIPEIEVKRFVARLVLLQIAEYLEVALNGIINAISDIKIDDINLEELPEYYQKLKLTKIWLQKNHPKIVEWLFA